MLRSRGREVDTAADGREGLEKFKARPPALILLDLMMPVMDGFEAIRRLKGEATTRAIPIIALTAHAMQEDMQRVLAAGADGYETKPVNINQLLEKMQALLSPP
jgi:two-component system cell cycle response regulator DivK